MYLKIIGGTLVCLSSTAIGINLSGKLSKRLKFLEDIYGMISFLKSEITYNYSPLGEAFGNCARHISNPDLIKFCNYIMEKSNSKNLVFSEMFLKGINENLKDINFLNSDDLNYLREFGSNLGMLDVKMQINSIDFYCDRLKNSIDKAREEQSKNGKMYRYMGISCGLFLVLVTF